MENQKEEFVKVIVDIPEPDLGVGGEGLWCVHLGNDVYEIRNSPWYARHLNWGDWVKAVAPSDDKWPVFESVVKRGGHRTIQIIFFESGLQQKGEILAELKRLGASYENNNGTMYAIDCPPEADVTPIIRYLEEMENGGFLKYQTNEL